MTLSMTVLLTAFPVMLVLFKGVRVLLLALLVTTEHPLGLLLVRRVVRRLVVLLVFVLWVVTVPIPPLKTLAFLVMLGR